MKSTQTLLRLARPAASVWFFSLALAQASAWPATGLTQAQSEAPAPRSRLNETYGKLPLNFEANQGQSDGRVKFISRGGGYTLFLASNEAVLRMRNVQRSKQGAQEGNDTQLQIHTVSHPLESTAVLRMRFAGGNDCAEVTGEDELAGRSNYLIGNDPDRWLANLPNYRRVRVRNVYPGIDVLYYGDGRQLEYDLVV